MNLKNYFRNHEDQQMCLWSSIVSEQIGKNKDETFSFTTLYRLSDGKTLNAHWQRIPANTKSNLS